MIDDISLWPGDQLQNCPGTGSHLKIVLKQGSYYIYSTKTEFNANLELSSFKIAKYFSSNHDYECRPIKLHFRKLYMYTVQKDSNQIKC